MLIFFSEGQYQFVSLSLSHTCMWPGTRYSSWFFIIFLLLLNFLHFSMQLLTLYFLCFINCRIFSSTHFFINVKICFQDTDLHSTVLMHLALKATETWPVLIGICYEYKIHPRFCRLSKKRKTVKYLNTCFTESLFK